MYYSCQMLGGSGGMPPRKILNFCSSEMAFWAKLATNIDPAIAICIYNYVYSNCINLLFLNNFINITLSFSL